MYILYIHFGEHEKKTKRNHMLKMSSVFIWQWQQQQQQQVYTFGLWPMEHFLVPIFKTIYFYYQYDNGNGKYSTKISHRHNGKAVNSNDVGMLGERERVDKDSECIVNLTICYYQVSFPRLIEYKGRKGNCIKSHANTPYFHEILWLFE